MIKMIKPVVNISKVIEPFDTVIVGLYGVLYDGRSFKTEAVEALKALKRSGRKIVLVSNASLRVQQVIRLLNDNKVPVMVFDAVVTAGEILHYKLKVKDETFKGLGLTYFNIGGSEGLGVFAGLDYLPVEELGRADFMYMGSCRSAADLVDSYLPVLEHAASLNMPLVCAGNDTSSYIGGESSLAPGAVAEQYAVLGGRIITLGKPDVKIIDYALDGIDVRDRSRVLLVGDNLATDIKGANLAGLSAALVTKAVHVNFLGEGYIPDVAKTRELATNFDAYPDFIISNLRW